MGVSYGLVAVLAIMLAPGHGGKATDRQGAMQTLAHDGLGRFVVIALAVGFAAYARLAVRAGVPRPRRRGHDAKGLAKRGGYLATRAALRGALLHGRLDPAGLRAAASSDKKETAWVLDWPAGRWIVGAVGAGFLAAALWNLYRGLARKFKKQLDTARWARHGEAPPRSSASPGCSHAAVVFGLIGIFLMRAAWQYDPHKAIGIDGALRKLAAQDYGAGCSSSSRRAARLRRLLSLPGALPQGLTPHVSS